MLRDYSQFPDDENGGVLWGMDQDGDDLEIPREMDFSVIFPSEEGALKFATQLLRDGQKVSFAPYEGNAELPWQVQAHPFMVPTHENITGYEEELDKAAKLFGGRNDGWGCVSQCALPE